MSVRYLRSFLSVMSLLFLSVVSLAQIPNAGFETWSGGDPVGWGTSNAPTDNFFNVTQSAVAHGGSSAVRGEIVLVVQVAVQPVIQSGPGGEGFAHTQRSAAFTGQYQFYPQGGDRFGINVILFNGGVNGTAVALAAAALSPSVSSYTAFNIPFQYFSADTPDTCVVQFQIIGPTTGMTWHVGSYFILDDIALSGTVGVDEQYGTLPVATTLWQNYPNPFNPSTTIRYALPQRSHVSLTVYNTLGQEVATLVNEDQDAGFREVRYDGSGLSSGVYLYRLRAGDFVETKRLLLLR